jgi:hypothetical protein
MPRINLQEVSGDKPITGVAEDISVALVNTKRGKPDTPYLTTGWSQVRDRLGNYDSNAYSMYSLRGFFDNEGRNLYVIRVVGDDARNAGGADDDKIEALKPQYIHGSGDGELDIQSDTRGTNGTLTNITIEDNSSDVTEVSVANTYDITLSIADTSSWKKSAKVAKYVLNGYAHVSIAGNAAPDATNSVIFYAASPGTDGNNYSVVVTDTGVGGAFSGADCSYSADGYTLTIDLDNDTPSAADVVSAVNGLSGGILAFEADGTGAGTWDTTVSSTSLAGGSASSSSLVTVTNGSGTGLDAVSTLTCTFLAGTGSVTAASNQFTDTACIDGFTAVTDKVVPGDKLIIYNGANEGCYEITAITGEDTIEVSENFGTTQSNCIWKVMGTDGEYGHMAADLLSPGEDGDNFSVLLEQETGGSTIQAQVKVTESDGRETILEKFYSLSPVPTNASYVDTIINAQSEWVTLDSGPQKIVTSGTGESTAGDNTLTDAGATFEDDEVEVGDYVIVSSATTSADVRVYEVTTVTDNTHIDLDANFTGTQADVAYTIISDDATGEEMLSLIGSDGLTITFAGGVDDTPEKSDYEGDESTRTGVYAIDNIPIVNRPRKMWCPEAPIVVDGSGVDATTELVSSLGDYCSNRKFLRYAFSSERGLTPTQAISAASSDGLNNKYVAEYYNWGKVSDPLTGEYKWVPLTGHMIGQADMVAAGAEGLVRPVANFVIRGVYDVEYEVNEAEEELLNNKGINAIIKYNGIRNMGDYIRTTDSNWKWLHKRDVVIVTMQSIKNSLSTWANWSVQSLDTLAKIEKAIDGYLRKYDMRFNKRGRFMNVTNPGEKPYFVTCNQTNNDLGDPAVLVEIGLSIPEAVEEVTLRYTLWDGGATVEEE